MAKSHYYTNLLGLAFLPLCFSATIAFAQEVIKKSWTSNFAYFFLGAATYLFIHLLFHKPILTYITGHEFTHALWGLIFGARIKKMRIGRRGGNVTMTKTNILVRLAPYIFPIYTFLIIIVYFCISFFWKRVWLANGAIFLIGLTFAFHIVLSLSVLRIRQSDLSYSGFLFSIVFIYLANIFVITLIFTLISHHISLGSFLVSSVKEGKMVYAYIGSFFVGLFKIVRGYISERVS